jgi:hypothetical protein
MRAKILTSKRFAAKVTAVVSAQLNNTRVQQTSYVNKRCYLFIYEERNPSEYIYFLILMLLQRFAWYSTLIPTLN